MRNIVGQVVRGEDFFNRPQEIRRIWRSIESGSHILISAPRRVGKTSLLFYLLDHPKKQYQFVYVTTESVNDENEYFKRLFKELIESDFINTRIKASHSTSEFFQNTLKKIKSLKILGTGIEFNESEDINYEEEFIELLKSLPLNDDKIIIMVDEFPQTIENIINNAGEKDAIQFLQSNREIRQDPKISDKVQFIYTGSIGLENIVSKLKSMNLINDLDSVLVKPLPRDDAELFIRSLLRNFDFTLNKPQIDYLLDEIEWLIPFHLQSTIKSIADIHSERRPPEITQTLINTAFDEMLKQRNYFEHWRSRLEKALPEDLYGFAENLLNLISTETTVTSEQIRDLAAQVSLAGEDRRDVINTLVYDGYINNNNDPKIYRFNSPLMRKWWYRYVAS